MYFIIDSQCGGKSTCTQTGYCFYGKKHVICSVFLVAQSKFLHQSLFYRHGFSHMTGCSVTHFNDIFPFRLKRKILIECGYTVGLGFFYSDFFRYISQQFSRQVTIFRLNILHDRNQRCCCTSVVLDDLIRFSVIRLV